MASLPAASHEARYTPYWLIRENTQLDETKNARNQEMFEHDMAPLRETITKIVQETDLKVFDLSPKT